MAPINTKRTYWPTCKLHIVFIPKTVYCIQDEPICEQPTCERNYCSQQTCSQRGEQFDGEQVFCSPLICSQRLEYQHPSPVLASAGRSMVPANIYPGIFVTPNCSTFWPALQKTLKDKHLTLCFIWVDCG